MRASLVELTRSLFLDLSSLLYVPCQRNSAQQAGLDYRQCSYLLWNPRLPPTSYPGSK